MTNREFYTMVANGTLTEEVITKANEEIAKLDARNAKRASKPSKKSLENIPIRAHIAGFLEENEGSHLASEIASALGISTQKVSALCRQMVADGVLTVEDTKVKGKGTQKSYSLA
jgi:GTP-sensing pleiotropic transcriptional regulator CodY